MKKISKILSIFLAVCASLTMVAFPASAATTDIDAGSSLGTATNVPSYGVDYVSSLSKAKEEDWFKFTTKSNEAYYTLSLKNYNIPTQIGYMELWIKLYDKNMQSLGQTSCQMNKTCSLNIKLETSTTYYIVIKTGESNVGNYQFTVGYKDDHTPNSMGNASNVSLNQVITESLDGAKDIDWYKFTTTSKEAEYKISLKNYDIPTQIGYMELWVKLYDKNMQNLGKSSCQKGKNCSVTAKLDANTTYYFAIETGESNVGNYEFSVSTNTPIVTKNLSSISVTKPSKTEYTVGESFNSNGLVVKAIYSDGTSETLSNSSYTVSGFNSSSEGTKTVTISATIGGVTKTASFNITVKSNSGTGTDTDTGTTIVNILNNIIDVFANVFSALGSTFTKLINLIINFFNSLA